MEPHVPDVESTPPGSRDLFTRCSADRDIKEYRLAQRLDLVPFFRTTESQMGPAAVVSGRDVVMLGGNNYLGLAGDARVLEAAKQAVNTYGSGCTGSRLLNGTLPLHQELESEIAEWIGGEACLVFTTGYSTNLGVISTLTSSADTVIVDTHSHASLIDAIRLSGAALRSFRHNSTSSLKQRMEAWRANGSDGGALVAIEGLYSMLGDVGPVSAAAQMGRANGARLLVDEAHAIGVLGPEGAGAAAAAGTVPDLLVGTFSKSLASCGGFVVGPRDVIDYMRLNSRPFLFTAAGVPAALGAALAAMRIARSEEWRREALRARATQLRLGLARLGLPVRYDLTTPIVAVPMPNRWTAVRVWKELLDAGVYTNCTMGSAVPSGKALLRLSVMATHTQAHIDKALRAFAELKTELKSTSA